MLVMMERVSAIAFMSVNGLKISKGTTDGDAFYEFVQKHLLPQLLPFNGTNPHSVVIMDNCAICHLHDVVSRIEE